MGKLPLIYRLYGILYAGSASPAIPVSPSINKYSNLMEKITIRSNEKIKEAYIALESEFIFYRFHQHQSGEFS
jgi:hypothetical protein